MSVRSSGRIGIVLTAGGLAAALAASPNALAAPPARTGAAPASTPAAAATAAAPKLGPGGRVIVLLKNHRTKFNSHTRAQRASAQAGRTDQSDVVSQIHRAKGTVTHSYDFINAVAARVTPSEAKTLAGNSQVQEVVPDLPIHARPTTAGRSSAAPGPVEQPPTAPPAGTCLPNGKAKLEPQALSVTRANSDVPGAKTARSLGYTGKNVTVGYIAEGIDIDNPDFQRNGKTIFSDYRDFSGEGPDTPTPGGEAFLDASAIAAQGNATYDVSHFSDRPVTGPCNIRIEGEAPGVNMVGLNIFGSGDTGFNSSFIEAIQYAATVDHVDVLNESLGGNPYPDEGSLDAVEAANDAAVAAGVTVTASSGDAGVTNTIGSPAGDPNVLTVGASTTYEFDLATGYAASRLPGITGWIDDNISSLSSSGYDQRGRTVDLVAPGELNYAVCSKDLTRYEDCADYAGKPIGVEASGGTSESAPIVAGISALVIEAYRSGHHGASPTPALIKKLLTSTSDDIEAPAEQQGVGRVDAYKAVQLAKSYQAPARTGLTVSTSSAQFNAVAPTGTTRTFGETVTNQGTATQTVSAGTRTLGTPTRVKTAKVTLSDARSKKYVDFQGYRNNVEKITFTVPRGVDRLNTSAAFVNASATDLAARVRMTLVDPRGRLAGYSLPQGVGNYGNSQVATPVAGTWTAWITSRTSDTGGTEGPVLFAADTSKFTRFGTVSPRSLTLAPGASGRFTLSQKTKGTPGDTAGALLLTTSRTEAGVPATTTVPVTLRSLVPAGRSSFRDTLTGGNGRATFTGQTAYYDLDVPAHSPELNAYVKLADNPNNQFYAQLIAPNGNSQALGANNTLTSVGGTPVAPNTLGADLHVLDPAAGRWTIIVVFAPQVSGTAISEPFEVRTDQSAVAARRGGLPNSADTKITSGTTRTVYVKVHNAGSSPEAFFADARQQSTATYPLASLTDASTTEPLTTASNIPRYLVPTQTTAITSTAATTGPAQIQADMGYLNGDPDIASLQGKSVSMSYSAKNVAQGIWSVAPVEAGPFNKPGPAETVRTAMTATTAAFDPNTTSSTGDLWQLAVDPSATLTTITVDPGEDATIPVRIHATGAPRTVRGTLYLDDAQLFDVYGAPLPNGNEVAKLSYTYSVVR